MVFNIIHIDETDSTNRWLKAHGEGTMVVVADYQTAGKGCGTNSWESERGKNLTFSMLIHPTDIPASQQFRITEVISAMSASSGRTTSTGAMANWGAS